MTKVYRSYKVGDVWPTKSGVSVEIIQTFKGSQRLLIKWLDEHEYTEEIYQCALPRDNLKNPYERTVNGVGFLGTSYAGLNAREFKKEKAIWKGIFKRSYDEKAKIERPGYKNSLVNQAWHDFGGFVDWTKETVGWGNENWQVDKDLLVKGNKEYGPETCCMLPPIINASLRVMDHDLPPGVVRLADGYYRAGLFEEGLKVTKRFKTVEGAFNFYKGLKETRIKQLAEQYKSMLDSKAYSALMSWEICIDD